MPLLQTKAAYAIAAIKDRITGLSDRVERDIADLESKIPGLRVAHTAASYTAEELNTDTARAEADAALAAIQKAEARLQSLRQAKSVADDRARQASAEASAQSRRDAHGRLIKLLDERDRWGKELGEALAATVKAHRELRKANAAVLSVLPLDFRLPDDTGIGDAPLARLISADLARLLADGSLAGHANFPGAAPQFPHMFEPHKAPPIAAEIARTSRWIADQVNPDRGAV